MMSTCSFQAELNEKVPEAAANMVASEATTEEAMHNQCVRWPDQNQPCTDLMARIPCRFVVQDIELHTFW